MGRGRAGVERPHTVSVRLSPQERSDWDARREASGRKELAAWVRDVVEAHVHQREPVGPASELDEDERAANRAVAGTGSNLNQLMHAVNASVATGALPVEVALRLEAAVLANREAMRALWEQRA